MTTKLKQFLQLDNTKLNFRTTLLLLAPIFIFFNYYPLFSFGYINGFFLEISLTEIYLAILALSYLPTVFKNTKQLIKNPATLLVLAFLAYNVLSLIWSDNFLRGFLTAGIVGALTIVFLGLLSTPKLKNLLPALIKILIASATAFSLFGWFQMFADQLNVPQNISLLCAGCRANLFGFARVNSFSVEPQFFGSLLLAPVLLLLARLINPSKKIHPTVIFLFIFLTATLFLTMSRGAIYALAIGVIVLFAFNIKQAKKVLVPLALLFASFILSLVVQGTTAAINPHVSETFRGATTKVIHQLSLGIIDIRPSVPTPTPSDPGNPIPETPPPPDLGGYVEESTDSRNFMSRLAIKTWLSSPRYFLIGAGVGGSPDAIYNFSQELDRREITNNLYSETILEFGIIGTTIFVTLIIGLIRTVRRHPFALSITVAFLVQWYFFSGYPNALHVYLILLFLVVIIPSLTSEHAYAKIKLEKSYEKQKTPKKK